MIIVHASWRVNAPDRAAYDAWFASLVSECEQEPGCLTYEYFLNPRRPERGYNVEVWEDEAALAQHLLSDAHVEIVRDNSGRWGSDDFVCEFWDLAEGYRAMQLPSSRSTVGIHGLTGGEAIEERLASLVDGEPGRG